jgi:hypothetical protein
VGVLEVVPVCRTLGEDAEEYMRNAHGATIHIMNTPCE